MLAEIAEHFDVSGFHQRLGFGIGEQLLKECDGVHCVATSLEPIALDGIGCLDTRIYPLACNVTEGIVVASYLQRRAESEGINVVAECPLKSHDRGVSLGVNPILTDFKISGFRLHSLAHLNYHQEHTYYLIALHSGDYVEIGFVSAYTLFGVAYLDPFSAVGTTIDAEAYLLPFVSAVHTYRLARFETIGVMVDGVAERPLLLSGGERAK